MNTSQTKATSSNEQNNFVSNEKDEDLSNDESGCHDHDEDNVIVTLITDNVILTPIETVITETKLNLLQHLLRIQPKVRLK